MLLFPHLSALGPYVRRYRRQIALGYLCVVAQASAALAVPWLLKHGVDGLERREDLRFLGETAALIVAASAVSGIFLFLKRRVLIGVSRLIEFDLRRDFYAHLQTLTLAFFHRQRTGDLMARATNDLNAVRDVAGPGLMYGMTTATTVVASLVLMLRLDPLLAGATLIPFPLMALVVSRFAQEVHRRSLRVQEQFGALSSAAQENIAGMRVVQGFVQEEAEQEHFQEQNLAYQQRNLELIRYRALFFGSIGLLLGGGSLLLLWAGGIRVVAGKVTLGELVAFMGYLTQLTWPFIAVGWVISLVQRGEAAMQRILEIWREAPEIQDGGRALVGRPRGELRFERVTFAYAGGPPVLRDIDLVVPAGSTLAIVGRTGAGKSSLVRLLPRLYDPTAGRVLLDGVDLREYRLRELRSAIGMVPQDPFLFSDTLAANLRFGRQEATDAEVLAAAATAGLEPDLETFSRGIRTRVGERGLTLSGGQRQRATLARALLANPAVLILDDALASVDKSTEAELLVRLRAAARGRTVILIAHRLSTIRDADRIVVLEEGRIVESGRHDELLPRGGLYAELARRQALAEALEDSDAPR